jgi:hypothetical protein
LLFANEAAHNWSLAALAAITASAGKYVRSSTVVLTSFNFPFKLYEKEILISGAFSWNISVIPM